MFTSRFWAVLKICTLAVSNDTSTRCSDSTTSYVVATAPAPAPVAVSTSILLETFENGHGFFQTNNGKSTNKVVNNALGSTNSIEMKSFDTQIVTRATYSVASYQQIVIKLWIYATKGVSGDSIVIEVAANNGAGWESVGRLTRETDFPTDKTWFERRVTWNKPAGTESIRLRIATVTTASTDRSKGKVYLENIGIDGIQ